MITALLMGCIFFCSCENSDKELEELNSKRTGVEEARDIEVIYTVGGKTKTIIRAPLMLRVNDSSSYYEFPDSVFADFYNEAGEVETKLSALYGTYKDLKNEVYLKDSVKVVNIVTRDSLFAEDLYWDRSRINQEFYTEKKVRIRTPTQKLNGEGLVVSQDLKNKLFINARGPITVPADKFPQ